MFHLRLIIRLFNRICDIILIISQILLNISLIFEEKNFICYRIIYIKKAKKILINRSNATLFNM